MSDREIFEISSKAIAKLEADRDAWKRRAEAAERALKGECTVCDAAPRTHGRWISSLNWLGIWQNCECSECKYIVMRDKPNYCPNCGAKMDLEDDHAR